MSNKVSFVFTGDGNLGKFTKFLGKGVEKLNKKFKSLIKRLKKTDSAFKKTSKGVTSSFKRMAAAAVAFLSIREFVGIGGRFQDAMADVGAITGATGKDLAFFSDEALRLSKVSVTAQEEVANAFAVIASAKSELLKDPKGLSNVTEQVLLLKNAAGIELAEATTVVTESLNQFGAGADQAARFVNVLAAGSKVGASLVGMTGSALLDSAVFAKKAKLSFEQLNSTIQVLAKNGIKGSKAGVALRSIFIRLEAQSNDNLKPSLMGLDKVLLNLSKANLSVEQSTKLFGMEAAGAADILIANRGLVKQWTGEITGTNVAQEQAAKRLGTFNKKMAKLGVTIKDSMIKVFLKLEPILSKNIDQFTAWFDGIKPEQIQSLTDGLKVMLDTLVFIGESLGSVISGVKSLGELAAKVTTGDIFSSGGEGDITAMGGLTEVNKILAARAPKQAPERGARSQSDVNIGITAPQGVVQNIKQKTTGKTPGLNVGVNMATAQ